ncbi:MAG: gamma-glutamyl-gamma-aminobutyrate hydrolase family protein [Acidobacteriia bacterium]|nr:gamma-glutamyl-gamma-aminobutyrate hydrolase family protein [Terriglobia bacterium]
MAAQTHIGPGSDKKSPRIGIPWRTSQEEKHGKLAKLVKYQESVRWAGGEAVLLSLLDASGRERELAALDGFVLPGSPADVAPGLYGAVNGGKSANADGLRDAADMEILRHAFTEGKPVLAICYGCQILNVSLGGTLVQDIASELMTTVAHRKEDLGPGAAEDPLHEAILETGSVLAGLAAGTVAWVNSSHHQAVAEPGKGLRITARARDGVVEAVERAGGDNWVVGVQWHPEKMPEDALAQKLFRELVGAAVARGYGSRA